MEASVKTQADCAEVLRLQMPFHFGTTESEAYRQYMALPDQTVYSPEVLAYTSSHDYPFEYEGRLAEVKRPALVISAESDRACTPQQARDIAAGIVGSQLVIIKDAGHMSYIEQPDAYFAAVTNFLARHPVAPAG
jgi:pimeloyl-ACP methyl ester carboxylesterase